MKPHLCDKLNILKKYPILVPILLPFIFFLPTMAKGEVLYWGTMSLQFIPWRHLAWEIFSSGEIPLWNPYVGMGAPFLANYQLGFFYPPNWILFLLELLGGAGWFAWGHTWLVAAHLALAGAGMSALGKKLGLSDIGQIVSGVSFGFSGYLINRISFLSINATVAWMPLIILFCIPITDNFGRKTYSKMQRILLIIVFCMMIFGGHAQTAWYMLIYLIMFLIFSRIIFLDDALDKTKRIGVNFFIFPKLNFELLIQLFFILLLSITISSIQIIPTFEYLINSQRASQIDYQVAVTYSYWPWRLITLFAPDFFGSPVYGDYWGYGNYWEDSLYFGVLPLVAVISLLFNKVSRIRRYSGNCNKQRVIVRFLFVISFISFFLALGQNTPLFPFLYKNIITFDMFQAPTRFSIWAQFSFALLAGIGIDKWKRPIGNTVYWLRLSIAGAFAIALGSGITWILLGNEINATFIRATARLGVMLVVTGILYYYYPNLNASSRFSHNKKICCQNRLIWGACLVLFLIIDLFSASWGHNPSTHMDIYQKREMPPQISQMSKYGRLFLPGDIEYDLKFNRFMRFDTYHGVDEWIKLRKFMLPNIHLLDKIRSVNNFDPLVSSRYARWIEILNDLHDHGNDVLLRYFLNLSNVHVVENINQNSEASPNFHFIKESNRFYWYHCIQTVESDMEVLNMLLNHTPKDQEILYIAKPNEKIDKECTENPGEKYQVDPDVRILVEKANTIRLSLIAPSDGYFMIADSWFPGWQVWVDGIKSKLFRGNYLFRAVYLDEGQHIVEFNYRPLSFIIGAFISLLGILILILMIVQKKSSDDPN